MKKLLLFLAMVSLAFSAQAQGTSNDGFKDSKFGFQYKMHTNISSAKPQAGDIVEFHQYVRKGDSLLQSTRQMGQALKITFPEATKDDKFLEAIKLLSAGDSMTVKLLIDSVGAFVNPPFKSGEYIFFDFKMVKITPKAQAEKEKAAMKVTAANIQPLLDAAIADYKRNKLKLETTATGLKYKILSQGTGAAPKTGDKVTVHYIGKLLNGTEFDASYSHGDSFTFAVGQQQVIPGWDEGLMLMKEGGKAVFFIPAKLGYGEQAAGKIPANSELAFYIDLIKAK